MVGDVIGNKQTTRMLRMGDIRNVLPWSTEDVSVADHGTIALLVQRLSGWNSQWRTSKKPSFSSARTITTGGGNGGFEYHVDALPFFARAAEIIALVRHDIGNPEEARDRLLTLNSGLHAGMH